MPVDRRTDSDDEHEKANRPRHDVPRYFRVACRFWEDEKARMWPDSIKLFALYLLTNRHRNLEGFFVVPPSYIAGDLGWSKSRVAKGLRFLENAGFLLFDDATNVLLILNALKFQQPDSKNVVTGVLSRVRNLPECQRLLDMLIKKAKEHCMKPGLSPHAQSLPELLKQEFRGRRNDLIQS